MKRILRLSTLTNVIVAASLLASLTSPTPSVAQADPVIRTLNGGYYYGSPYGPGYAPYSAYGYAAPYGYSSAYGYASPAPGGYVVTPSYRAYGFGNGFGTGATYTGVINRGYYTPPVYAQPIRPVYSPYGNGGYGPYGFNSAHHDYGY